MEDFIPTLIAYAVLTSPVWPAFVWANFTSIIRVKKLLNLTVVLIVFVVTAVFAISFLQDALCEGSQLKGYTSCQYISAQVANLLTSTLLAVPAGAIWTVGVLVYCGVLEFRARRQPDRGS